MIDLDALERHCRLAFASWDPGPPVDYHVGRDKSGTMVVINSEWQAMADADKAYWRALWAPLFEREENDDKQSRR